LPTRSAVGLTSVLDRRQFIYSLSYIVLLYTCRVCCDTVAYRTLVFPRRSSPSPAVRGPHAGPETQLRQSPESPPYLLTLRVDSSDVPVCRHSTRLRAWSSSSPLIFLQNTRCFTHTCHASRRQKFRCRRTARVEQFAGCSAVDFR